MKKWLVLLVLVGVLGMVAYANFDLGAVVSSKQKSNDDLIAEGMAFHIGTQAYIYAYPFVDMRTQMHNETNKVTSTEQPLAAVNRLYRFPNLITPTTAGNLRAPNNDTLYFSGWYDISQQPLIIHTPNTNGRYYTIAVTNQYAEVIHLGRRTTGTAEQYFGLTTAGWQGSLPEGVQRIIVETTQGWLLGRMLVDGEADFPTAMALVQDIWLASLDEYRLGKKPAEKPVAQAKELSPYDSLEFFRIANEVLKEVPLREQDAWLLKQFDRIGIGPTSQFDPGELSEASKRGLERALEEGAALVKAATQRTIADYNGWMISKEIGRYSDDYLHRASVVKGGYGNLPEESLYPAMIFDANGEVMHGSKQYRLRFEAGQLPPVNGFWSLAVYRLSDVQLVENELKRYSIGDRTPGLEYAEDGSLTIAIAHEKPAAENANWLPSPKGHFMAVMRLYEPQEAALDFSYTLPRIEAK